jgi:hypothetical protein
MDFEDDDLFELPTDSKALKAAKKDIDKVMPKEDEDDQIVDEGDNFAKDWINITDDDEEDYEDD